MGSLGVLLLSPKTLQTRAWIGTTLDHVPPASSAYTPGWAEDFGS